MKLYRFRNGNQKVQLPGTYSLFFFSENFRKFKILEVNCLIMLKIMIVSLMKVTQIYSNSGDFVCLDGHATDHLTV